MSERPSLTEKQKKHLRGLGHALHPLVTVGQSGVTDGVRGELERALADHELVKVKVRGGERAARDAIVADLAQASGATLVARIGHIALYYRRNRKLTRLLLPGG